MLTAQNLRWFLTVLIFFTMSYCFVTQKELYPFAPYTMYSWPFRPDSFNEIKIFFGKNGGEEIEITPNHTYMIMPFDEARLKVSFDVEKNKNPEHSLNTAEVRLKAQKLLQLTIKNTGVNYDYVAVGVYVSKNLEDLRAGIKTPIEKIYEKNY